MRTDDHPPRSLSTREAWFSSRLSNTEHRNEPKEYYGPRSGIQNTESRSDPARHVPGLIRFAGMENDLEEILGRKVDLLTPMSVSPYFRDRVLKFAVPLHDAA